MKFGRRSGSSGRNGWAIGPLERLEARDLPATCGPAIEVLAAPTGDLAILRGTPYRDVVQISQSASGAVFARINGLARTLPASVRYLYVTTGAGADRIVNDSALPLLAHAGAGNDYLRDVRNGSEGAVLFGDGGEDTFLVDPEDFAQQDPEPGVLSQVDRIGDFAIVLGTASFPIEVRDRDGDPESGQLEVRTEPIGSVFVGVRTYMVVDALSGGQATVRDLAVQPFKLKVLRCP